MIGCIKNYKPPFRGLIFYSYIYIFNMNIGIRNIIQKGT